MKIKKDELTISILFPLAVGTLSGFITTNAAMQYRMMEKPPFSPPGWVFPVVWTILYVLMGVASYLVIQKGTEREDVKAALKLYLAQLVVNFIWPILFFSFGWYLFSFIWILLLWVLIQIMMIRFYKISKGAAYLMIPYLLWVTFAAYLNFAVYRLNV